MQINSYFQLTDFLITHIYKHTDTHKFIYTNTHTYKQTITLINTYTHLHTLTHTYTHTQRKIETCTLTNTNEKDTYTQFIKMFDIIVEDTNCDHC